MTTETLQTKTYWLQQQLNGAVAFMVLTTIFVTLKLLAPVFKHGVRGSQKAPSSHWHDGLIVAALLVFLPLCVSAIGK